MKVTVEEAKQEALKRMKKLNGYMVDLLYPITVKV